MTTENKISEKRITRKEFDKIAKDPSVEVMYRQSSSDEEFYFAKYNHGKLMTLLHYYKPYFG